MTSPHVALDSNLATTRWLVIVNQRSGNAAEGIRSTVDGAMKAQGAQYEFLEIGEGDSAAEKIGERSEEQAKALLVIGGDGTVMEVVNGMMIHGWKIPLGIVPTGTANFIARALDIPQEADEAIKAALTGCGKQIDVGQCGDRFFALGVGLGLAERFVTTTEDAEKKRLGPLAYLISLFREMRTPRATYFIEPKGEERIRLRGVAMVIANTAGFGHGRVVADEVKPDDGLLDVVVLRRISVVDALRLGFKAMKGDLTHDSEVNHHALKEFVIHSEPKVPIQIDGDDVPQTTPLQIKVHPKGLTVLVRPSN